MEALRQCPMGSYTIEDRCDQTLVCNLTGATYPMGTTMEHGCVNETHLRERSSMWGRHRPDEVVVEAYRRSRAGPHWELVTTPTMTS